MSDTQSSDTQSPRWEQRFRAPTLLFPAWSPDAPERLVYSSNETGTYQLFALDRGTGQRRRLTDDAVGLTHGIPSPDGSAVVWFHDATGDEFGHWVVAPFHGGQPRPVAADIPDGWPAGFAQRGSVTALAMGDRDGFAAYVAVDGAPARLLMRHQDMVSVGGDGGGGWDSAGLSADGSMVAVGHSEHGDRLHPALRVFDVQSGEVVGDLWDGEGLGLHPAAWAPEPGDPRLTVVHERDGIERPAIWDVRSGERRDLSIEGSGEAMVFGWYPAADALLVAITTDGRDRLVRLDLADGSVTPVEHPVGTIGRASVRPDGRVWMRTLSGAEPASLVDDTGATVLSLDVGRAPEGRPYGSWEYRNPQGQRVHGFLVTPSGDGPWPTVMEVHGGPTWLYQDTWMPTVQAFVDAGFAVAMPNYRGSTGYGTAWRDALIGDPGFPETEDVVAGLDDLIALGVADPARVVVRGDSWGGYISLLCAGLHPQRWAAAVAGVPVADYIAAYEDEAPSLQMMDRGLFGGGPEDFRAMYEERSPITYVDRVSAPLLILAGENDSRCPIRQIDNYVTALRTRGGEVEMYRYTTGHSSFVVEERVRQVRAQLGFVARHVPGVEAP
ncbi:MAG: prolyl oligopeptidase family serine peptidase [Actinobacteria bacterium]|nr:prolyl oligopeptidase family serine peptidase [Actinomycetota bacterium]